MAIHSRPQERWARLWELFAGALERPPQARASFLTAACGDDEALRVELTELLAAHAAPQALIDRPAFAARLWSGGLPQERWEPGTLLVGRFEIERLLGEGGMGSVYAAVDRELGARIALKTLRPEVAREPAALARFRREVALAREVTHPNVCRIFDLWQEVAEGEPPTHFLTMELLEGETLAARIAREGPLPPDEALEALAQIAEGLVAAHAAGVVHRDLKPANVLLVSSAGRRRAVVTDFGLACAALGDLSARRLTVAGQVLGTPLYMAPEQLLGETATAASDVYAFGVVAYEAITGELPHDDVSPLAAALKRLSTPPPAPRTRRPELDPRWDRAIAGCLERQPPDRFRSPAEMVAVLRGRAPRRLPLPRRRRKWVAAATAVAAVLAIAATWMLSRQQAGVRAPATVAAAAAPFGRAMPAEPLWLLVAAFANRSGEPLLDGTIEHLLERDLNESGLANVAPRQRIDDALRLMGRARAGRPDTEAAREVALRDGGIQGLVGGRIERVGSSYVLTADLIDPHDGRLLHSVRVEAAGQEEILPAVGRLAAALRTALGEPQPRVRASEAALARVTTPSLRALQLYSQADAVIGGPDDAAAEELLRQAIAEDPGFASAYMHLAYALRNQRRPAAEYLPLAERALALADNATDRERYFIRGSYYGMTGDDRRALASWQALLRVDPSHYWALGNVGGLLQSQSRDEEAVPYALRLAEVAPRSLWAQAGAAQALAIHAGRPQAAEPYVRAAQRLLAAAAPAYPHQAAWIAGYPAHRLWVEGRAEAASAAVEAMAAERGGRPGREGMSGRLFAAHLAHGLGRWERASELMRGSFADRLRSHLAAGAFFAAEPGAALGHLGAPDAEPRALPRLEPLRLVLLARLGRIEEARRALPGIRSRPGEHPLYRTPVAVAPIVEAEIALASGDAAAAAAALERWLPRERPTGSPIYFLGADALATARRALGDPEGAVAALEEAGGEQGRSYGGGEPFWLWVRWRTLELDRELGRDRDAAALEAELRRLLAVADPEFWLLRRLDAAAAQGVKPSLSASPSRVSSSSPAATASSR